jgi:hypothetical protein
LTNRLAFIQKVKVSSFRDTEANAMSKPANRLIAKGDKTLARPGKPIRLFVTIHVSPPWGMCSKSQYRPGSVNPSTFLTRGGRNRANLKPWQTDGWNSPSPSAGTSISRAKGSIHPRMPSYGADFYSYLNIRR